MGLVWALLLSLCLALLGGCGGHPARPGAGKATAVKAVAVLEQDVVLSSEYAGQVRSFDEVKILPRVSGTIVEKFCTGGEFVKEGQILYRIDPRQYESAVLSASASLAQSEAVLENARLDLQRYERLLAAAAVPEKAVTTQRSKVHEYEAMAAANAALLKKAQENFDDTTVYAPLDGRLDVNDVAVGTYANAGQTVLATIGSVDPVYVQFSISEMQYLSFLRPQGLGGERLSQQRVTITLSNGDKYPFAGSLAQADRALAANTGTLTVKALFANPSGILLPGMFARVRLESEVVPQALLVPERALQQILDKTFVITVGAENKSETRPVELGEKIGSYYIIKSGLQPGDVVVVEGLTRLQAGMDMEVTMVTPEEMGFTLRDTTTEAASAQS